jgi:hypothetical protein
LSDKEGYISRDVEHVVQDTQAFETIEYRYIFDNDETVDYTLHFEKDRWRLMLDDVESPEWTRLEHNQCGHCPLSPKDHEYCPAAKNLSLIGNVWDDKKSFDNAVLEVRQHFRVISGHVSIQVALSSLVGLLLATSDCPYLSFFRPLARFHQPLGNPEDAGMRVLMAYLAYIGMTGGSSSEIRQAIEAVYNNIDKVNKYLAGRITHSAGDNASVQAIVQLDCLSKLIRLSIDDSIEQFEKLFSYYEQYHSLSTKE